MNLFEVLKHLYTNRSCEWLKNITEEELRQYNISPFVLQLWLIRNDVIRKEVRYLDRYVFHLSTKQYLSLAWSIIPKTNKTPFVQYGKKIEEEEKYEFLTKLIRKQYKLSDNDFKAAKSRIIEAIEKDKISWFKYYGIEQRYWKKNYIDFRRMRDGDDNIKKPTNLFSFV